MRLTDVFPPIPRVQDILVLDPRLEDDDLDFWVWMRCLQGLVNRDRPHLYLIRDTGRMAQRGRYARQWLEYYDQTFGIQVEEAPGVDDVLERYRHLVEGYSVYDTDQVLQTANLGITGAGLDSVLPVSESQEHWMKRHGIPRRDDLRGRFADNWEAAEWAIDNLWPRCYRRIYGNFCIHRAHWFSHSHEPADFVVYHRGMALDLPTSRQRRRVLGLYRRMLEAGESPGVQMNWHCAYDQEKEYVAEAAKKGYVTLQTMFMPNLTVHGGVGDPDKGHVQPLPDAAACRAERGKVYVCFYNSDGDAAGVVHDQQGGNWEADKRGSFKFGWGFLPLTVKLMPAMMEYYHRTRTPNDCFWGPASGAAYTYSFLLPGPVATDYLEETRRLLDQSGQNGCNLVNWHLQDWWREVEDDDAIRREQELLGTGPGLVCGLGGSPYARSYLDGPVPKVHSVHVAGVGRDNFGDIIRLSQECPTRPLFLFLFAQISHGIWEQLESELPQLEGHPEIEILSMDEFFLTLRDALDEGLLPEGLYQTNEALAERWLRAPGRHRLPIAEKVTAELAQVAHADPAERRRHLSEAGWTDLVSRELEGVAGDRDGFLAYFKGRVPFFTAAEETDALLYSAFTVAWHVVRAAIMSQGVYANHRIQCLADFQRLCAGVVDTAVFDELFAAWDAWEQETPALEQVIAWCDGLAGQTRTLRDALGPDEDERDFSSWPPRTI